MKPRVLIVVDKPGWAFDIIAKQLILYNDRSFEICIQYLKGKEDEFLNSVKNYDLVFFMHWSLACFQKKPWHSRITGQEFAKIKLEVRFPSLDYSQTIVGIHAHHDHDDRKSMPDKIITPPENLIEFLGQFKAVNAVSKRLTQVFQNAGLPKVFYSPNGVNTECFKPIKPISTSGKLRVGCSGTKKRDWKEGITEFIEPLGDLPFIDLRIATPEDGRYVPHDKMPEFLNEIDVYVLASSSEGFPLKALEPAACGRPILSTQVGGCEDFIKDGVNGYFVERNLNSFCNKLKAIYEDRDRLVAMGKNMRLTITNNWTWAIRTKEWLDFIEENLHEQTRKV